MIWSAGTLRLPGNDTLLWHCGQVACCFTHGKTHCLQLACPPLQPNDHASTMTSSQIPHMNCSCKPLRSRLLAETSAATESLLLLLLVSLLLLMLLLVALALLLLLVALLLVALSLLFTVLVTPVVVAISPSIDFRSTINLKLVGNSSKILSIRVGPGNGTSACP